MSYPDDPLDLVVEIAPGADPGSNPDDHTWVDITDRWRVGDNPGGPIVISRGKSSPLSDTVPGQCSLTLDNADGAFTPRNPIGPYYPDLQRNTPLRVVLRQAYDEFDRTASSGWGTADSGQAWTTSGGSASDYSVADGVGKHSMGSTNVFRHSLLDTGLTNHTLTVEVTNPVVPTGAAISHWIVGRCADTSNYYYARLDIAATTGATTVTLGRRVAGSLTGSTTSASVGTHTASATWRVVFDVRGSRLRAKAWKTSTSDPGWQVELTDTALTTGTQVGVLTRRETGNTNSTPVITYDNVDVSSVRFTGYVDRWPPRWDSTGNNRWVPITAHGVLRRLSTAGDATRSALYRYLTEQSWARTAYWPMEDGSDATEAASADDQAPPMSPSAPVRFGNSAPGSSGVSTMVDTSGAYLHARLPRYYALTWRLECVVVHSSVPTGTVRVLSWLCTGNATRWDLNATSTGFQLVVWNAVTGGSTIFTINTGVIPQPGQLHHLRVDVDHPSSNVQATVYVDGVSSGTGSGVGYGAHVPNVVRVNPDADETDNLPLVGHLIMWGEHPAGSESDQAALGYPGEQAHERIAAVCTELDVPYLPETVDTVESEPMGSRPTGSLVAVLRDAEATDGGILYELTSGHLSYRRRNGLYNQDAALTLDYEQGHISPPFEPSDDDAQLRNDVSARRPSGSEARYSDSGHIAQVGRYETSLSVNPEADATLEQLAAWAVHRGTVTEQRFDTIAVHMARASDVIGDWLAADIGSRIQVDNVPSHLTPDPVDVILAGYTETFQWPSVWRVEMVCEPASSWTVGVLDDDVLGRLDTAGSELATGNTSIEVRIDADDRAILTEAEAASFSVGNRVVLHGPDGRRKEPTVFTISSMSAPAFGFQDLFLDPLPAETIRGSLSGGLDTLRRVDETSLSVATTTGPVWTTDAGHVPFDLNVDGEQVTVTAVSGASSPQTLTVTRAVNGVEKHHGAGTSVRLWQPLILGL